MPEPPSRSEPKRSPYRPTNRSLRENQLAKMKYEVETVANPSQRVDTIIASARSFVRDEPWKKIAENQNIKDHAESLKTMGYSNTDPFEHGVTNLLNLISLSYVRDVCGHENDDAPAIVFSGSNTRDTIGDYLGACSKPDTSAFMATLAFLLQALTSTATAPFRNLQEWTNLIGIGEWKPEPNGKGQVLWYLSALKRYRPDLDTVYGMFIENNSLRVMSHNACGTSESDAVDLGRVDWWIAFVVHLYRSHASRDPRFEPVTVTNDARARWRIRTQDDVLTFRPFHAGSSPGRATWLSFEQDALHPDLATGFLKVSWQDASAQYNEPALLELAHKDGWLPGLVRPRWTHRDKSNVVCLDETLGAPKRVKEMVHLASIGEPLSQCRSLLHLFKVIFDAIGVHDDLLRQDILHRDMSWFNILCNPWHDPETLKQKDEKKGVPCIDFILTGKDSAPSALVLDLDHAAVMTQLYSEKHNPRKNKSGTPMFVAVELSSAEPESTALITRSLIDRLHAIDDYPELVERAFPGKDTGFMKAFEDVLQLEGQRLNPREYFEATTDPGELHRPRHDVESIFWVLLWGLLRAAPLSVPAAPANIEKLLCEHGNDLLDHELGIETRRGNLRVKPPISALHPVLKTYGPLIQDMATYLSIPWHLYTKTVPELPRNHVHIAFRRMLLVEIYKLSANDASGDVFFSRQVPRPLRLPRNKKQDRSSKPARTPGTGSSPALPLPLPQSSGGPDNSVPPGLPVASVHPLSNPIEVARMSAESASSRGTKRGPDQRDFVDIGSDAPPMTKRLKLKKRGKSALSASSDSGRDINRLINMFWDDRILWFGVGDHQRPMADNANSSHVHGSPSTPQTADVPASLDEDVPANLDEDVPANLDEDAPKTS